MIQTKWQYAVYSFSGTYLGLIANVTDDFMYNQNIATAGTQIQISVPVSTDTAAQAVSPILDEAGNQVLDEAGSVITDEGVGDIVGSGNANNLIQNGNQIIVTEFSQYHPNGVVVFTGYISKWKAIFGSTDDILVTCISNGQDLNNYLVAGGNTADQTQTSQDQTFVININHAAFRQIGQTFTVGGGITNISAIKVKINTSGVATPVTLNIASKPSNAAPVLATATQTVNTSSLHDVTFSFSSPLTVTASSVYFLYLTCSTSAGVTVGYNDVVGSYTGGNMYIVNYGGGGGTTDFTKTPLGIVPASQMYFTTYYTATATYAPFINKDPSFMLSSVVSAYVSAGGQVSLDPNLKNTGIATSYAFRSNTILEAIQAIVNLAPANWYWYVDPATNILYFKQSNTVADFILIKGRHINELDIEATKENIFNSVYFTGGDDGTGTSTNIFVHVSSAASLANNRVGMARLSDNRVNSTTGGVGTAQLIANNYMNENLSETYITNVSIQDTTMDISTIKLGMMCGFAGFGNFVDRLLLQVVGINRQSDLLSLQLGVLPIRSSKAVEKLQTQLAYLQTVDNPGTPS